MATRPCSVDLPSLSVADLVKLGSTRSSGSAPRNAVRMSEKLGEIRTRSSSRNLVKRLSDSSPTGRWGSMARRRGRSSNRASVGGAALGIQRVFNKKVAVTLGQVVDYIVDDLVESSVEVTVESMMEQEYVGNSRMELDQRSLEEQQEQHGQGQEQQGQEQQQQQQQQQYQRNQELSKKSSDIFPPNLLKKPTATNPETSDNFDEEMDDMGRGINNELAVKDKKIEVLKKTMITQGLELQRRSVQVEEMKIDNKTLAAGVQAWMEKVDKGKEDFELMKSLKETLQNQLVKLKEEVANKCIEVLVKVREIEEKDEVLHRLNDELTVKNVKIDNLISENEKLNFEMSEIRNKSKEVKAVHQKIRKENMAIANESEAIELDLQASCSPLLSLGNPSVSPSTPQFSSPPPQASTSPVTLQQARTLDISFLRRLRVRNITELRDQVENVDRITDTTEDQEDLSNRENLAINRLKHEVAEKFKSVLTTYNHIKMPELYKSKRWEIFEKEDFTEICRSESVRFQEEIMDKWRQEGGSPETIGVSLDDVVRMESSIYKLFMIRKVSIHNSLYESQIIARK